MRWRLILTGHNDAFFNMAVDEAIMELYPILKMPTIRLYGWQPAAVSIGCFQSLDDEVDIKECDDSGIDYIRRITGGGAVFHDKELTYSIVVGKDMVGEDILDSYKMICGAVVKGLKSLSIPAEFAPINDILVDGKKISGNAQTRRGGVVLQHGTIILDTDVDKMFTLLKVPDEKLKGKMIQSVKKRVTSVLYHMGHADFEEVASAMRKGFEREFRMELEHSNLDPQEVELAKRLIASRYSDHKWTHRR